MIPTLSFPWVPALGAAESYFNIIYFPLNIVGNCKVRFRANYCTRHVTLSNPEHLWAIKDGFSRSPKACSTFLDRRGRVDIQLYYL
jgi:hypothetical protein